MDEGPISPHPRMPAIFQSAAAVVCGHPRAYELVSLWIQPHFPKGHGCCASSSVSVGHLYFFFEEMSIQVLCSRYFLIGLLV